jgi:hypothetical protein
LDAPVDALFEVPVEALLDAPVDALLDAPVEARLDAVFPYRPLELLRSTVEDLILLLL